MRPLRRITLVMRAAHSSPVNTAVSLEPRRLGMWSWPASSLPRCTRLFDSMSFKLNHRVFYEETDLLLRYGRCSFELLHGHGCGRRDVPVQLAMSLYLAVMLVTKHNLPECERDRSFVVTNPVGKKRSFDKLMDLAQWAAANALGKPESEWLMNGRDVE